MRNLKELLIVAALSSLPVPLDAATPATAKKPEPKMGARNPEVACVITQTSPHLLECNVFVGLALKTYDPNFGSYVEGDYLPSITAFFKWSERLAPFAAVADFNGDGTLDVVIDGHSRQRPRLIAVLSRSKRSYNVIEIQRSDRHYDPRSDRYDEERGKWKFISRIVPAGRVTPLVDDPPFDMKFPGVEIEYWQKAASVFFWRGKVWGEYASSD